MDYVSQNFNELNLTPMNLSFRKIVGSLMRLLLKLVAF